LLTDHGYLFTFDMFSVQISREPAVVTKSEM